MPFFCSFSYGNGDGTFDDRPYRLHRISGTRARRDDLTGDVTLRVGDEIDLALADIAETRLTVINRSGSRLMATEEGRAEPWTVKLTEHGLSDFPVLIVQTPVSG